MVNSIEHLKNRLLAELCSAREIEPTVNRVLEVIGSYFNVDRAYIFENTEDDNACCNTFEWCNAGIEPEIQNLQHLDYKMDLGMDWLDNYNAEGLFFCPTISALPPNQRAVLEPQGIFSMLHCAILERGEFKGYIGFDNCQDHPAGWESDQDAIDTLVFASRLLSLYLLEYRNKSRLTEMVRREEEKQQRLQTALDEAVRGNQIINHVAAIDYDYIMVVDIASDRYQIYTNDQDSSMAAVPQSGAYSRIIREYAERYVLPEDQYIAIDQMSTDYVVRELESKTVFITQARLTESDGRECYKRVKFSFLDQQHTKILITRNDVTDLITDEEKKRASMEKALNEARTATKAKTDFLARMSHDIRTPMNAIIGLTALSLDEEGLTPRLRENLNNIRGSGDFLLGLVNDILDMSKIESGAVRLKQEPYLYTDFLAKLRAMFEPQCKAKNIRFDFEDVTLATCVMVDRLRMDQIFFNILSNAVKFTPEGGRIAYYTDHIVTDGRKLACDYIIEDNGIGMSPEFLKRIFEPFEQEDTKYSAHLKGSGLGLSIAKSLTELMGGSIRIESREGVGTKVTVHLEFTLGKIELAGAPSGTAQTRPEADSLQGKRVLLVEDHPLNAQIAKKLLEKKSMIVVHAGNGQIALNDFETSAENFFSAVLMDIRMPVMDGLEATRAIRALKRPDAARIPIIAMSANAYDEDVQKSMAAGMNEHLAKPVDPALLYHTLERYLN